MIHEFSEIELKRLKDGLEVVSAGTELPHIVLREQLLLIRAALGEVTEFLLKHPFVDGLSEICYYKSVYPQFKSLQLYCLEWYALVVGKPVLGAKLLKRYYQEELVYIDRFFSRHQFAYTYYSLKSTALDAVYFTVSGEKESDDRAGMGLPPVLEGHDAQGCTLMAYMFAKFMAYERLRKAILERLRELEPVPVLSSLSVDTKGDLQDAAGVLKWTGEKINLIELVHGIHLTRQVNGGKIGIGELFKQMGAFFGLDLYIPKRGFDDLKVRKRLSKTHFIDKVREALLKKMDEEDAFSPKHRNF